MGLRRCFYCGLGTILEARPIIELLHDCGYFGEPLLLVLLVDIFVECYGNFHTILFILKLAKYSYFSISSTLFEELISE